MKDIDQIKRFQYRNSNKTINIIDKIQNQLHLYLHQLK